MSKRILELSGLLIQTDPEKKAPCSLIAVSLLQEKPVHSTGHARIGVNMSQTPEVKTRTEVRDGMRITWHEPIQMDDGIVLRADVYRPIEEGRYPVILTYGVYAKGLSYQEGYPHAMAEDDRRPSGDP